MGSADSVIIHHLDLKGISLLPEKANAPAVVYADAVLSFPIAGKCLKAVPWRNPQIVELPGIVQNHQLPLCPTLYMHRKSSASLAVCYRFGVAVPETPYHSRTIVPLTNGVKRYYLPTCQSTDNQAHPHLKKNGEPQLPAIRFADLSALKPWVVTPWTKPSTAWRNCKVGVEARGPSLSIKPYKPRRAAIRDF